MFKKGLVTLVCLTVMSALWSWATTSYSVATKINSLGTVATVVDGKTVYVPVVGGNIKTRIDGAAAGVYVVSNQTNGIKYSTITTDKKLDVDVAADSGYKIASVTKKVGGTTTTLVTATQNLKNYIVEDLTASATTQDVVVTFAADVTTDVTRKTWQLQVTNNNAGGGIALNRAGVITNVTAVVKPLVKNFLDTTPVTITATPADGYSIDYVVVNGIKDNTDRTVAYSYEVNGSNVLNTFNVGYKKNSILVTTNSSTPFVDNGIAPINPKADPYGNVKLIVTPTGANNTVETVTASAGVVTLFDRYGQPTNLPHFGPVKVTITGITGPITVNATYSTDLTRTPAVQNCTNTCHVDPALAPAVKASLSAAATEWAGSVHSDNPYHTVDCVGCHVTMPGPALTAANNCKTCHAGQYAPVLSAGHDADPNSCFKCHNPHNTVASPANCGSCHATATTEWTAGAHGTASGHTTGTCQRCHATEGSIAAAENGWTGSYATLMANQATLWATPGTSTNGIKCAACHDAHSGELRQINTYVAGAVVAWDPNANAATDQYDVCTSCHSLTDNTGAVVGNYHDGGSINVTRTISDSHFDLASTGTTATGTLVEGYAIRTASANPCADCHNLHSADLTVQEQWAKSGHAGGIAAAKDAAACTQAVIWANTQSPTPAAVACTDSIKIGTSTRTALEHFQRNAAGIAFYKTVGATDATGVAWTHYNWDQTSSRGACQRCHTATGSANFLTNPAGYDATGAGNDFSHLSGWTAAAGSPQQELLYCWGCHSDSQTGALRNPGALALDYSTAANDTVTYPDFAASNVCVSCHSGMGATGNTIKNTTGDFNAMSALQPHYLAAAGVLAGRTGYEFAGVTYTDGYHKNLGVANFKETGTAGPCVACHMTGAEKHTFEVSANATCAKCHEGLTDEKLEEAKTEYNAAVEELNQALKAKGIWFIPSYPYFVADNGCVPNVAGTACESYDAAEANNGTLSANEKHRANGFKTWDTAYPGKGKDTMGAAFNFNLLVHEPGAFAHNRTYAYQLIASSIDFLNDGLVSGGTNVNPANLAKELLADETHINVAAQDNVCSTCHAPSLPAAGGKTDVTLAGLHAVGQAEATPAFTVNGADLDMTFTAKVDGAAAQGYSVTRVYRYFQDPTNGWVSWRYPAGSYTVSSANGVFTIKIANAGANSNSRYYVRLEKAGAAVPRIASVGNYPASPVNDLVTNASCTNCHGGKIPVHEINPLSFEICVVCHGADKTTSNGGSSYSASTYPKLPYLLHGIHASEKVMPSGKFTFGGEDFKVAYPTYLNNCSVCHQNTDDLATVTAKPVSYSYCMTCHENFTGFDHGNTVFGGEEHAGFTAATDCSGCHNGKTVNDYHNGLLTERSGVIWNGVDTSITEGAKINTVIDSVERVGGNLVIKWSATMNGTAVDPCYGPSDAVDKPSWKNAASGFSVLRAYSLGDDWANAGISTSPGQPASTSLDFTAVTGNTVCASNVATTTIALSTAEKNVANTPAGTKVAIALQGKVNLYNANTTAPAGVRAKTAYQAYQFQTTDGALTTYNRRDVTDTNNCLKCHPGSLYQHGGNRIDSMELCVMCHNETSSEQNVRLLDGVDATEAYDGKVGQTYGFKTLLHALHSATENDAITMIYRTNGNYVFTGEEGQPANYPTGDVFADDAAYAGNSWFYADDQLGTAQAVGTGSAALIFGSSAAHGTGPQTVGASAVPKLPVGANGYAAGTTYTPGTQYQVYRAHNVIRVTYPQDLKNCTACHKDGGYNIPNAAVATPTVVDAGTVGLGGSAPSQSASNAINSNIADDLVIGAATAACMSCHNANSALEPAKKTWLDNHAKNFGYAPVLRANAGTESCTTCHKP